MFRSKFFRVFFVIVFLSIFSSWISSVLGDDDATFQNGIHHFTSNFFQILHQKNMKNLNILFSPINIYAALLLLYLGSGSTTRDEITYILEVRVDQPDKWPGIHEDFSQLFESLTNLPHVAANEEYHLNLTDLIFVNRINLKKRFVNLARSYYDSYIIQVNFEHKDFDAVTIMNKFIANEIEKSVQQFYSEPQTTFSKVILTSCLHFKSWWKFPFRKSATKSDTFYTDDGAIKVHMMQRVGYMTYANLSWLSSEVGCLKANPNISVFIILPYKESDLRHLLDELNSRDFYRIVDEASEIRRVDFRLPRLKLQWIKNLDQSLYDLGAKEMFTPQADFQNMTNNKGLNVSEIKYVADIRITEHVIEATSVTGVKISSSTVAEPNHNENYEFHSDGIEDDEYDTLEKFDVTQFYANRPFFMFIYRHDIKLVMFVAAVNNPSDDNK